MEKILGKATLSEWGYFAAMTIFGACFLALCSWIRIPFYPVPFTLQTFAVFVLAFTLRPGLAFSSVIAFLIMGTCGVPVFGAKINALWITGKCAGYLVAFPIAAYLVSKLLEKGYSVVVASLVGQTLIFGLGYCWLSTFFGAKLAFTYGVMPFIFSDIAKIFAAYGVSKVLWRR